MLFFARRLVGLREERHDRWQNLCMLPALFGVLSYASGRKREKKKIVATPATTNQAYVHVCAYVALRTHGCVRLGKKAEREKVESFKSDHQTLTRFILCWKLYGEHQTSGEDFKPIHFYLFKYFLVVKRKLVLIIFVFFTFSVKKTNPKIQFVIR